MTQKYIRAEDSIKAVRQTSVVPTILEIICRTTGLGFAAVARVTPEQWIACEVRDEINFGLLPGGELKVDTTICHEIRQSGVEVVIDHVAEDEYYCAHHTPLMYGFQSYISVPIRLADGSFFGTLCAIDPNPAQLTSSSIRDLFKVYAALIALLIDTDQMPAEQAAQLKQRSILALRAQLISITGLNMEEHMADEQVSTSKKVAALPELSILKAVADLENIIGSLRAVV